jgi:hypothetical protein
MARCHNFTTIAVQMPATTLTTAVARATKTASTTYAPASTVAANDPRHRLNPPPNQPGRHQPNTRPKIQPASNPLKPGLAMATSPLISTTKKPAHVKLSFMAAVRAMPTDTRPKSSVSGSVEDSEIKVRISKLWLTCKSQQTR